MSEVARPLSIALVHHPILDGAGEITTTAVTNLDVHDLSRSARTYGVENYFIVHPIAAQRALVQKIVTHWTEGSSGRRIPDRAHALRLVRIVAALDNVYAAFGGRDCVDVWVTSAKAAFAVHTFDDARAQLRCPGKPVLLLFGTGWGLANPVMESADACLEPIRAQRETYNHLSVRSACAIALDRLFGR